MHADTQGQNFPVFALATLFGFDLMPRIRNFKDLIFFRASEKITYPHIDQLFGESGRNVIDWKLIDKHWIDLMQVAISISEGRLSSATLMRRLRSNSRKNRIYKAFREVGRSVRTVALLRYLADPALRARVTAATNKVESYNGFSKWLGFGGVLADNDPEEQEKLIKFNTLLANLVVFHNALDISDIVRQLVAEGWQITADQLGQIAPYLRAHISRFGAYATDELRHRPDPFDPLLTTLQESRRPGTRASPASRPFRSWRSFSGWPADVPPGVAGFVAEQLETRGETRGPLTGHRVSPRPSSHGNCAVQADKVFRVRLRAGPEAFLDHGEPEVAPLR
nr:transposase [Nonomuraea basaltis]